MACEFSGVVRDAFSAKGHNAWSCDLLPTERPGNHIQDDVLNHLNEDWDLMIAHPPCTYLSYAATRVWNTEGRKSKRDESARFFFRLWECSIPKVCIENPVGWINTIGPKPDQIIEPFYFGDNQRKRTCLWLRGLPPLWHAEADELFIAATHCDPPKPAFSYVSHDGRKRHEYFCYAVKHNGHARSKTFPGIAQAMANQWG